MRTWARRAGASRQRGAIPGRRAWQRPYTTRPELGRSAAVPDRSVVCNLHTSSTCAYLTLLLPRLHLNKAGRKWGLVTTTVAMAVLDELGRE